MTVVLPNETQLERIADVASYLGISPTKVYLMMNDGVLPYVKLGKSRRIPRWAVLQVIEQNITRDVATA